MRQFWKWILALLWALAAGLAQATVEPPLQLEVEVQPSADGTQADVRLAVMLPMWGSTRDAQLRITARALGGARLVGTDQWVVTALQPGQRYTFQTAVRAPASAVGRLRLQAVTEDAEGRPIWSRAQDLFLLRDGTQLLHGRSSPLELQRQLLQRREAAGQITPAQFRRELRALVEGRSGERGPAARSAPEAVFDTVSVSGSAKYTQRTAAAGGVNTFAAAAAARAIVGARVEFYDDNAGTQTLLTSSPAAVNTDASGRYAASVPGKRADGTAVQLVVKVSANSTAATIGPIGIGTNAALAYKAASAVQPLDAASKSIDLLVNDSNPVVLAAFAIREGIQTAYTFVTGNNARTGVGVNPATIFIEYPGSNANGSFFSTSGGDHLNIGLNHGFDWDVYTHEYGHYVQKLNGTSQNPGGRHTICGNATGLVQPLSGGASRTLTKDQGLKLAWGEGWPTFFGTNLQIASGAGAFGIFGVGDTVYTDTGNGFSYDLEANSDRCPGAGEDSELSVQRILWDFADQPQDANDAVTFGTDAIWRQLHGSSKPVTLDQFRALFDGLVPGSPAGYSTGTLNQNRVKYGRIYADHNVGPVPLAPAENFSSATPPQFRWSTKGAGPAPSYRFNKFKVVFFNKDYSTVVFTSPEIPTAAGAVAADGNSASWTPTAAEWQTIVAGDALLHWVVQGSSDTTAPATGPYFGQDRTIGGLNIVFVIDDTGSMGNDIAGVRAGLTNFITQLRAMNLPTNPTVEVITFKDSVTRRIVSNNLDQIQAVVNSLTASGGGDCPEASAQALLEAATDLPSSGGGGTIIFATDASPHSGYSLAGIQAQLRAKGIAITELLTGDCAAGGGVTPTATSAAARAMASLPGLAPVSPAWSFNPGAPGRVVSRTALWPEDVICPDCTFGIDTGPFMSPNILKLVGDPSVPTPSSVASFAALANASPRGTLLWLPQVKQGDLSAYSTALTNAALGAVAPAVIATSPQIGYPASTLDVEITGGRTNFGSGSSVSFGPGITVNSLTPVAATKLVANISIAANAATGPRDVVVSTVLGGGVTETTTGSGQFAVGTTTVALLESLLPSQVARGTSQRIQVYGVNTAFGNGTTVSVGNSGVQVTGVTVESPTKLQVDVNVAANASLGFASFRAVTGSQTASFGAGLLVVDSVSPPPALPVLTTVTPASGVRGATGLAVTVAGSNTNFLPGVTVATLGGAGVDVVTTTVLGPTQAVLQLNISPSATLGFRDVLVVTNGETAAKVAGFQVLASTTCDLNNDGRIDTTDINAIVALRNQPASANPLADANADGVINVFDARICTARCTKAACAP